MTRVYLEVFGCSANAADAEIVSGLLVEAGHALVSSPDAAEAIFVLTCIVKTPTEMRVTKRLREFRSLGLPLVVAGCMPKVESDKARDVVPRACLVGPDDILRSVEALDSAVKGASFEALEGGATDRSCLPRVRRNEVVHIAPISSGCLGSCSYCIVRLARGHLSSFAADKIVKDAETALGQGCREIWVTAEDTAAYRWRGVGLPRLLRELSSIEGRFFIRVGMMTPNQAGPILGELLESYRSEKVFKFLHLPVQSGNDEVLGAMGRRYTVDDFLGIVSASRDVFPSLSLSTDIICGFPGETEEQFMDSVRLVETVKPDVLNISRFWPRPGTEAARMVDQVHGRETKRRSRMLTSIWRKISQEGGRRWIGWEGEALVDEAGQKGTLVARNFAYKPIVLGSNAAIGEFVNAKVTDSKAGYLIGEADQ